MANYCDSDYRITGEASELDALYNLMLQLEKEKENGNWVGHIINSLNDNTIPEHLYVRGWWDCLDREEDCIFFHLESAWEPLIEAWDFIASKFQTLQVWFSGEEPGCEVYEHRPNYEKGWFTDTVAVDLFVPDDNESRTEYFPDKESAYHFIENYTDSEITSDDDVEAINEVWQQKDEDAYLYLHEFTEV